MGINEEHQEVTVNELGSRVNRLDVEVDSMRGELGEVKTSVSAARSEVAEVKATVAASAIMVEGLREDLGTLFGKMDRWSESQGSVSATRGMIPATYVTWGIGLMVSLATVGLTILGLGSAVVIWAQSSGDTQVSMAVATNAAEIAENQDRLSYLSQWRDDWLIQWGELLTKVDQLQKGSK